MECIKAAEVALLDRRHRAILGLKVEVAHNGSWRLLERRRARRHDGSPGLNEIEIGKWSAQWMWMVIY